jgi:hypothetical protein
MASRVDTERSPIASDPSLDEPAGGTTGSTDTRTARATDVLARPRLDPVPAAPAWPPPPDLATELDPLPPELLADLDAPHLVLSDGYLGPDRRRRGPWARILRTTFPPRRAVLSVEVLLVAVVLGVVLTAAHAVGLIGRSSPDPSRSAATGRPAGTGSLLTPLLADPLAHPAAAAASRPTTPAPSAAPAATTPPTTPPAPVATAPAPAPPPAAAPPAAAPAPPPAVADPTPQQLGAEALALVRYPWQSIPGYSIQFDPISAAPSPGFYGNTTFTWGQTGGTSVLYVYPGETVDRLAGITAFEIGHEVDAAAVDPQGGETQIENILGIHPASWAPNCDCAEQGFLSGWYAAAFSNYWSPGVGDWSQLAPEPTGATLAAIEPWLNPTIP